MSKFFTKTSFGFFVIIFLAVTSATAQEIKIAANEVANPQFRTELSTKFRAWKTYELTDALLAPSIDARNISLQLGTQQVTLTRNFDGLTDANSKLIELTPSGRRERNFPTLLYFNDPNGRITLGQNFISGEFVLNGSTYFVEQVRNMIQGAGASSIVVYNVLDVISNENLVCGVEEEISSSNQSTHNNFPTNNQPTGICRTAEIAVMANSSSFQFHSSNLDITVAYIASVYNLTEGDYTGQFNDDIKFKLREMVVSTSAATDPWTHTNDISINLNQFNPWGITGFQAGHDISSYWFHTPSFGGGTIGLAWVGNLCNNKGDAAVREYGTSLASMRCLVSHEHGHNFSYSHDPAGAPYIMAPSVNPGLVNFSPASITTINNFLGSSSTSCLTECAFTDCERTRPIGLSINYNTSLGSIECNWISDPTTSGYTIRWWEIGSTTVNTTTTASTASSFTIPLNCNSAQRYRVEVAPLCASNLNGTFEGIDIFLATPPTATQGGTASGTTSVCIGSNGGTITLVNYIGDILKWQFSIDNGVNWTDIANTTPSQSYSNLTTTTQYRAIVKSGSCPEGNSVPAIIEVNSAPVGGTTTGSVTSCSGRGSGTISLSGNSGNVIGWQTSIDNGTTWVDIPNTNSTMNWQVLTKTTRYRAVIRTNGCTGDAYSTVSTVTVEEQLVPSVTLSSNPAVIAKPGENIVVTANTINVPAGSQYHWFQNGKSVGSTSTNTFTFTQVQQGVSIFKVDIDIPNGNCVTVFGISSAQDTVSTDLLVFPNPFTNFVSVAGIANPVHIRLIDAVGHTVMEQTVSANRYIFNTSHLPRGIYMIWVTDGNNNRKVFKVMKQ